VEQGQSYTFNTNEADEYGANVRCTVNYKKMASCERMSISCSQFDLGNGDMLRVIRGGNKRTFRGTTGPNIQTTNNMRVIFKSNREDHGTGASCTVSCVSG